MIHERAAGWPMSHIVQITDGTARRVALVDEPRLRLLERVESTHGLAAMAIGAGTPISTLVEQFATGAAIDYDEVYAGRGAWRCSRRSIMPSRRAASFRVRA